MPEPDEELLLARVSDGDEFAFRLLYRRHTPAMYAVALRLLARRVSDAEDAVQEAWLRAVRNLGGFRGDSALRTWLIGITIRCALEAGRRRPPAPVGDLDSVIVSPRPPSLDLDAAITSLADGYRQVLVLHDIQGYTHDEIAELLGIEPGTSKSQLSRARGAVRRWFARVPQEITHER